jgi:hypothetical protein
MDLRRAFFSHIAPYIIRRSPRERDMALEDAFASHDQAKPEKPRERRSSSLQRQRRTIWNFNEAAQQCCDGCGRRSRGTNNHARARPATGASARWIKHNNQQQYPVAAGICKTRKRIALKSTENSATGSAYVVSVQYVGAYAEAYVDP